VSWSSVRGGTVVALGSALAAAIVCGALYGASAGWGVLALLVPLGLVTVGCAQLLLAHRRRLGGLRRQLTLGGAIVVGQLLIAVALFVRVMFVSAHDAVLTALVVVYAGAVGLWAARAQAHAMLADIEQLRGGLQAIGAGCRPVSLATHGGDELSAVADDIERMVVALDAEERARSSAERAHRDLIAAVSHDLRTPITSLALLADALRDDLVDEATREEYVVRMGVHVRALGAMIDDLFELSRLQAGDVRWSLERVRLNELLAETIEAMRPAADAVSIAMSAELGGDVGDAHANPEQIQRVLFNLIQNAIRHTPADGSITVRAETTRAAVEIEVADTGRGIAARDRSRVFDPFFQGANQAARSQGSAGLGLAISRAIVEAHGGRMWLPEATVGTRVRFSLPASA
jgi:signal transduction histidine kinase